MSNYSRDTRDQPERCNVPENTKVTCNLQQAPERVWTPALLKGVIAHHEKVLENDDGQVERNDSRQRHTIPATGRVDDEGHCGNNVPMCYIKRQGRSAIVQHNLRQASHRINERQEKEQDQVGAKSNAHVALDAVANGGENEAKRREGWPERECERVQVAPFSGYFSPNNPPLLPQKMLIFLVPSLPLKVLIILNLKSPFSLPPLFATDKTRSLQPSVTPSPLPFATQGTDKLQQDHPCDPC